MVDARKVALDKPIIREDTTDIELGTCHIVYRLTPGSESVTMHVEGGKLPAEMQDFLLALAKEKQEPTPVEEPVAPKL